MTLSIFDDIRGLGKKRMVKLLQTFNGPKEIAGLTPEVISAETKIPIKIAKEIIKVAKK